MPRTRTYPRRLRVFIEPDYDRVHVSTADTLDYEHPHTGESIALHGPIATLSLDPETVTATLDLRSIGTPTYDCRALAVADQIRSALLVHTVLARLAATDPAAHGLVARVVADIDDPVVLALVGDASVRVDTSIAAPEQIMAGYGWFAPDADPEAFGTCYLAPWSNYDAWAWSLDDDLEDSFLEHRIGWALHQVGLDEPLAHAVWDDSAGIAALIELAADPDPEAALVMRVLDSDAMETIAEARRGHDGRAARLAAQDAWTPAMALRPRAVLNAITATAATQDLSVGRRTPAMPWHRRTFGDLTVSDLDLSYVCERTGRGDGFSATNAGRAIEFGRHMTSRTRSRFHTDLAATLADRDLGIVVRVTSLSRDGLIIVKDAALLRTYPQAFGISAGDHIDIDDEHGLTLVA